MFGSMAVTCGGCCEWCVAGSRLTVDVGDGDGEYDDLCMYEEEGFLNNRRCLR